jgi:pimeloyl-ACP methyl ester carboxylesterase
VNPVECQFDVLGLKLAARRWHRGALHRVIALHGWLDNAASFDLLAPCMPEVDLVALDLAGHGLSDHRAAHAGYLIWDDLREILAVADALAWPQFSILGHSRGAVIGSLLAAACPSRVAGLGLIDGFWAMTCPATDLPAQMQRTFEAFAAPPKERVYAALEDMVVGRCRGALAVGHAAASRIVTRNALQTAAGWVWRTDSRLQKPSLVMLTAEQQQAAHAAIVCPAYLVMAEDGMGRSQVHLAQSLSNLSQIKWVVHPGGHHLHMEGSESILGTEFTHFFEAL